MKKSKKEKEVVEQKEMGLNYKFIGKVVKFLKEKKNYTDELLAVKLHCSANMVYKLLKEQRNISSEILFRLYRLTKEIYSKDIQIEDFFTEHTTAKA